MMVLDPLCFAVLDSTPHGLGFDDAECMKLTQAKGRAAEDSGAGEVRGWRQWSSAIHGTSVKRSDTGQGTSEEWCKGAATDPHVLHMVDSLYSVQLCAATSAIRFLPGTMPLTATSLRPERDQQPNHIEISHLQHLRNQRLRNTQINRVFRFTTREGMTMTISAVIFAWSTSLFNALISEIVALLSF